MVVGRVRSRKVSMGFLRERVFSRDQPCETETSRETILAWSRGKGLAEFSRDRVSHGLVGKVLARPRNVSQ